MSTWILEYDGFDAETEGLREALCTLGNGFLGTRGAAPEARADGIHYPATYAAGVYNRLPTTIAGQTLEDESIVNLPNWLPLTFRAEDGCWLEAAEFLEHRVELDLRRGVLTRFTRARDDAGRVTQVTQRRIVSMDDPHLAALETTVVPENWSGRLEVRSLLDGNVANSGVERYRTLAGDHLTAVETTTLDEDAVLLRALTKTSRILVAEAARTRVERDGAGVVVARTLVQEQGVIGHELAAEVAAEEPVTIEKVVAVFTSRDPALSEPGHAAGREIAGAPGFSELLERHVLNWHELWRRFGISLEEGEERTHRTVNLHVFHLLQTLSRHTAAIDVGVPARGLHGEAYRGHVFWDELFVFPFVSLRLPRLARSLLRYRYRRLREARRAAQAAGFAGAMFPWQSGSDGREETQQRHLNPRSGRWSPDNSSLQRHINAAIAYNVWQYYQVTGDDGFLGGYGAELIIEIARFWSSIASYNRAIDRHEIRGVMGPDEYHDAYPGASTAGLDNNAYTNVMAVWVFCRALDVLELLPSDRSDELRQRLSLTAEEVERWEDLSRKMRLVFHEDGILSQFEGYEQLEEFDWGGYRSRYGDISRLDRILESEGDTPNRYKVSKQADVLMLFYLFSAEELGEIFERLGYDFDEETIPKAIDYYLDRTSHGSTLSRIVHAWVLARSDRSRSWDFYLEALESDVSDSQGGTTAEGIHLGAMVGTLDLLQRCYTGLEIREEVLRLNPQLPTGLRRLAFTVLYRGQLVELDFEGENVTVASQTSKGAPISVGIRGTVTELQAGGRLELSASAPPAS
ncbi:MAG TPA: glycosyl hydrolase family 65 protein [Gaiellaceae bacterium]|nr:glycosyl hydrolase family 65 protein [Gaiellaceae bacterium]